MHAERLAACNIAWNTGDMTAGKKRNVHLKSTIKIDDLAVDLRLFNGGTLQWSF